MVNPVINRFIRLFTFLFISSVSYAQQGNYFLSHFAPSDERMNYLTFGITQDAKGVMYFANKNGVLEFDGRNWKLIGTPGPVFTIATAGQNVFLGGLNGFGKIDFGSHISRSYQSLSESQPDAKQIFSSLAINDKIYFSNSHAIYVISPASGMVETIIKVKPPEELEGLLEVNGTAYAKSTSGILKVDNGKLIPSNFPWHDNLMIEFSATSPLSHISLLSVAGGRLFLADGNGLKEIDVVDKDFLIHNIPIAANWLTDELVAIGTLRGGIIFINPKTGITQKITNYYTGLPDNEVYSMMVDRNQGLWVAHDYGFTRVAPFLPFSSFSHYPGLEGSLLCAKTFNGETYVGTTLGLYMLVKQDVTQEVFINSSASTGSKESKKKKGLFSFLRKNTVEESGAQKKAGKYAVKLAGYVYKRVEGIDGKVTQLIEHSNQLLAAGIFGISTIEAGESTPIMQVPVRSAYVSSSLGELLASTLEDEIKSFSLSKKGWKETNLLDTLNDYVSYIFEDKLQNIWLCGRTDAIKIETVDGRITAVERVPFSNPTIDESVGIAYGTEVYVATGGSFHRYDLKENVFKKYDSLPGPKKYFASAGYFWFNDGHRWRTADPRKQAGFKLEWLSLFQNIRFIAPADNESLWVITGNNELYRFSESLAQQYKNEYPLFLREVRAQQSKIVPSHSIIVSQLENTVDFEFIQPDFLGMKAVEYRYQVKGLSKAWTQWASTNNIVNFSYLPTGKYRVDIQTRDITGKVSKVEEISLEIEPPYWQRPWFYLIEVIFFSAMVFLSMRLSAGNKKYRIISQLLSLLTVIMVIQFVQAIVNAQLTIKTTPVIDFFIQVGMALLVLPFENYLRKFMTNTRKGATV